MTISYGDNFLRVLLRWKGSAWKAVWKEMILWLILYYSIRVILEFALTDGEAKNKAKSIVETFDKFTDKVPLTFLLGFYVVQVVGRWWKQVQRLPWPDELMSCTNVLFPNQKTDSKLRRHTIARYLILCQMLALRDISTRIRKRFPKVEMLVQAGLMTEEELTLFNNSPAKKMRWQLPIHWITHTVILPITGMETGNILPIVALAFINQLNAYKANLRDLYMFDWVCIPLVYTQTVSVVVYGYFGMCLLGHQFYGKDTDIYIPVLTIFQFIFYVGWLKVAQDLMRPFGEDDDDVELNCIIDRNSEVAFSLANYVPEHNPRLTEDSLFRNIHKTAADGKENVGVSCVQLAYSKMSLKGTKNHSPKLHANVKAKESDDMDLVFVTPTWSQNRLEQSSIEEGPKLKSESGTRQSLRRCKSLVEWFKKPSNAKKESVDF